MRIRGSVGCDIVYLSSVAVLRVWSNGPGIFTVWSAVQLSSHSKQCVALSCKQVLVQLYGQEPLIRAIVSVYSLTTDILVQT